MEIWEGRLTLTAQELAKLIGIHPTTVLRSIRAREIRATMIGGRWLIPVPELKRLLRRTPDWETEHRRGYSRSASERAKAKREPATATAGEK